MFSPHTHAQTARAEQRACGRRRKRSGSERIGGGEWPWSGNGGGGPVTAGSPVDRTEEVAKARGSGWTGWAGRFEKAHRGAGPDRAGQEDEVGVGVGVGEQRSGVQRSSRRSRLRSAGIGAQRAARSRIVAVGSAVTRPGRGHRHRVDVFTIARPQWARRRARSFNEAVSNRGALSPQVQPVKEVKGRSGKEERICVWIF